MKTLPRLLRAAAPLLLLLYCPRSFAQEGGRPTPAQTPRDEAALTEAVAQLEAAGLARARVGVHGYYWTEVVNFETHKYVQDIRDDAVYFSSGFRFVKVEGCTVTLRNDGATLLPSARHPAEESDGPPGPRVVELRLWLGQMSAKKNKKPRLKYADPEKARVFGAWRTEFSHRGFFARYVVGSYYYPEGQPEKRQYFEGDRVSFSFDDPGAGRKFHAALLHAVNLCEER